MKLLLRKMDALINTLHSQAQSNIVLAQSIQELAQSNNDLVTAIENSGAPIDDDDAASTYLDGKPKHN